MASKNDRAKISVTIDGWDYATKITPRRLAAYNKGRFKFPTQLKISNGRIPKFNIEIYPHVDGCGSTVKISMPYGSQYIYNGEELRELADVIEKAQELILNTPTDLRTLLLLGQDQ